MIRYTRTAGHVLASCPCGWREVAVTDDGARRAAANHARRHRESRRLIVDNRARRDDP